MYDKAVRLKAVRLKAPLILAFSHPSPPYANQTSQCDDVIAVLHMFTMAAVTEYISVACNRVPKCVHWGECGYLAFGTCNSVAITKHTGDGMGPIEAMLNGHKDRVNCVRFIESPGPVVGPGTSSQQDDTTDQAQVGLELVSGSTDGSIIVWQKRENEFVLSDTLTGHKGSVMAIDALRLGQDRTLIVSASSDFTVRVWERRGKDATFREKQSLSVGKGFALDVALTVCQDCNACLLALGGDDCMVHLYAEMEGVFSRVQSLAGHEDWIQGLEFACDDSGDLLLASCAQDCFIRVWRISRSHVTTESSSGHQNTEIQLKKNMFSIIQCDTAHTYSVSLESVLAGHEQWIYAVHWQRPTQTVTNDCHQPLCLLSASMDKTMIVWRFDEESGMWLDEVRVGEVGGNTLGLYGCQFSPDGRTILAHGYQGAFHVWTRSNEQAQPQSSWTPTVVVSGHFAGVHDLAWNPDGQFLLSVGLDQTTRLHAPWKHSGQETWHEIARPQVHGYDMQCLAVIGDLAFVSGADEKVLRVFEAPTNFLDNFERVSGMDVSTAKAKQISKNIAEGASVPALGLSNKAVYQGEGGLPDTSEEIKHPSQLYPEVYFAPVSLCRPPTEDHLLQNTLWPETQKLYGHGYEIFSVDSHPSGTIIASACKASKAEHAAVILWDTSSWQQICQLVAHSLTVTQLAFSHNGQYLLAVSRDRTWSLFEETSKDVPYDLIAHTDKKTSIHSRIIWACSWSHDDLYFATASRDKKVIIWGKRIESETLSSPLGSYQAASTPLDVGDSATAVDFAGRLTEDGSYILAIGLESGNITIHTWNPSQPSPWKPCYTFPKHLSHTLTVKRLRWRPRPRDRKEGDGDDKTCFELASCSSDGSVRIHSLHRVLPGS